MKKQKGLTIVEILIVIGIIGLLASIILIITNEARERAKIAASLNFAAQVHHSLGAYAAGIWDFNEGGGITAADASGNENDGTINGEGDEWTDDTSSGKGYALSFDGSDDYVEVEDVDLLSGATQFTIMYWVKPAIDLKEEEGFAWYGGVEESLEYRLGWQSWTDGITVDFYDTSGTRHFMDTDFYLLKDQWYHIVGLYDGDYLKVYINAELIKQEDKGFFTVGTTANTLKIGYTQGGYWDGIIDDVRIYIEALALSQIKKIYAQGLDRHSLSVK